jgi:hypothetical protein
MPDTRIHVETSHIMSLKRKSAVAARHGERTDRSKQKVVKDGSFSTGSQCGPSRDPFARLNLDIVNLILFDLSLPDLTCCERVSNSWRDTIYWWVTLFGFRIHFPHIIWDLQGQMLQSGRRSKCTVILALSIYLHFDVSILTLPASRSLSPSTVWHSVRHPVISATSESPRLP